MHNQAHLNSVFESRFRHKGYFMATDNLFDQTQLREAFGHFPSGVAAIAAHIDNQPHVIVASSFSVGVSLEPPLAAFYVQNTSSTWPLLKQAPRIGVSILSYEHAVICRQLASRDKNNRFNGVEWTSTPHGAIHLANASGWFDCSVYDVHSAGDHLAIQLLIHDLDTQKENTPLIFHGSEFVRIESQIASYA